MVRSTVSAVWLLAGGAVSCAPPGEVRRIGEAHPGAQYEGAIHGCGAVGPSGRRFGANLRLAILWSREVVHEARAFPCEVVIEAVDGDARQPVYHVARDRAGVRTEGALPPSR